MNKNKVKFNKKFFIFKKKMLEKLTYQIFAEKKMKKFVKVSRICYFLGVILVMVFPLLSEYIKIEEKQLRNTSLFARKINNNDFSSYLSTYFSNPDYGDEIFNFCTKIFQNTTQIKYNEIFTKNIISPRGRKMHLIQINLIYDRIKNLENTKKTNFVFYALIKFLSDKKNIAWLAKDIQINYVTKELFDEKPKECFELLTSAKYNERLKQGIFISAIYNFDLSEIDLEKVNTLLIKIVGVNSEHVDIDFYKMVITNFHSNFQNSDLKITTHEPVLSKSVKKNILSVLNSFNDIIKNFVHINEYKNKYMYIIQDIINDYFFINNKITTNNLLISNNFNSLLIKTLGQTNYNSKDRGIKSYYNLVGTIILMIKGMNIEEIDIFRGLHFYIFTSPYECIGYSYLFILILMTLRAFFHLMELIYQNEYRFIWTSNSAKKKNEEDSNNYIYASRIVSGFFFMGIIYAILFINIDKLMNLINSNDYIYTYYFMIGNIFVSLIFILFISKLSKSEEKFINIILMYLLILNCWNFVFVNVGIGLAMSVIIMSMEFIFLNLKLVKYCIIKIGILGIILYGVLTWKELINSMVDNYIKFHNNVYIIITITIILLVTRLALFIIMISNKYSRKESWDIDEVINIEDENNEDINEENKEEENKNEEEIIEKNINNVKEDQDINGKEEEKIVENDNNNQDENDKEIVREIIIERVNKEDNEEDKKEENEIK